MKVSVLITTHERPEFLRKVLEGYALQVRMPEEIVVADDGSGPATRAVIKEFRKHLPCRVIHARQEHHGPRLSRLRNLGTRMSSGEYIIYTDGDCIPRPHFVADHLRLAQPGWFVQGTRIWIRDAGNKHIRPDASLRDLAGMWRRGELKRIHWALRVPGLWVERKHLGGTKSCNLAVFRGDVEAVNGWNEDFTSPWREDSEFCRRLMRLGIRRRDARFSAVSFHLDHPRSIPPADHARNDRLLEEAKTAPIFTPRGLVQAHEHQPPHGKAA